MKKIFLLMLLLSRFSQAHTLWLHGQNGVGIWQEEKGLTLLSQAEVRSAGFDRVRCQMWVDDKDSLKLFSKKGIEKRLPLSAQILGDVERDIFLTRSHVPELEVRNAEGDVMESLPVSWVASSDRVIRTGTGWASLGYKEEENHLWVDLISDKFELTHAFDLSKGKNLWAMHQMFWDKESSLLWFGFTTTAQAPYAPRVEARRLTGEMAVEKTFLEKGVFFGGCVDNGSAFIASRDISTPPYTVPVYSFLERGNTNGNWERIYAGETNYFLESLICTPEAIYMVERSIFGSDGSRLVRWDRKGLADILLKLPFQVRGLYACNNR